MAYETLELIPPSNTSISYHTIKFEQLHFKAKSFNTEILDGVLAYTLIHGANVINEQKKLVKANAG